MTEEQKQGVIDAVYRGAKDFGIPVIILGVLLWFLRDGGIALHKSVVEPVVQSHLDFLRQTQDTLKTIGEAQEQQVRTMREISDGQRDIQQLIGRMHGVVTEKPGG